MPIPLPRLAVAATILGLSTLIMVMLAAGDPPPRPLVPPIGAILAAPDGGNLPGGDPRTPTPPAAASTGESQPQAPPVAPTPDAPPSPAAPMPPVDAGAAPTATGESAEAADAPEPEGQPEDDAANPPPPRRRVHLIIDRLTEIGGVVLDEDETTIVIDDGGRVRSFPKTRLLRVVPLVDPEPGQLGVVRMRDGGEFRGIVLADGFDGVHLEVAGIQSFLPRASVLQVLLEESDLAKYQRFREAIPAGDHMRRLALCRWLFDRRMYLEAQLELRLLIDEFDLGEARRLLTMVEAQLALERPRGEDPGWSLDGPGDGRRSGTVPLRDLLPQRLLSRDDVNLIRIYEIDFERPPRIQISPDTIRELIERYGSDPRIPATSEGRTRMFRADPVDLVRLMFQLRARDLYPQIDVQSEPFALNLFRQRVHDAWLIGNCATSGCHGGVQAGRFFLHRRNHRDDRVRYTNLLILLRSEWGDRPLVDFERPLDSLIIQHALPRNEARFPHPRVPGWKPVFTNSNQRLLADSVRWIQSMYQPRPNYPVEFEPPTLGPAEPPLFDERFPSDPGLAGPDR